MLQAGIHPTIAGVIFGFMLPAALVKRIENTLHGWVVCLVMPLFALANAGVYFGNVSTDMLFNSVTLGVALGLFCRQALGVLTFTWC